MSAPWRSAMLSPVVPGTRIHAMALTPFMFLLFKFSLMWLLCCLLMMGALFYIQVKGMQPAWLIRRLKSRLRGQTVTARSMWYRRRRNRIESFDALSLEIIHRQPDAAASAQVGDESSRPAPRASAQPPGAQSVTKKPAR